MPGYLQNRSSTELTQTTLREIAARNPELGAFVYVAEQPALAQAQAADRRREQGLSLGPLDGLPVSVKANIAVDGWPFTAGLKFRSETIATADAFVVQRLKAAGAVLLGLTNLDEGALGAEGNNPWYRTTENPRRSGYSAGGSSSGAAAAVTANLGVLAIGTDTIGSLRIPAAFCGCVSLKPSYGLVSTRGVLPVHGRFDHVGPLARNCHDLALAMPVLAAVANDSNTSVAGADRGTHWHSEVEAAQTIGYAVDFADLQVNDAVVAAYNLGIAGLRKLGHRLVPVDLGRWDLARLRRAILTLCELAMWRVHRQRITARPEDFSAGLRAFIRYGGQLSDEEIMAAESRIAGFCNEWQATVQMLAALVLPTVGCQTFPHRERRPQNTADLTAIASATGQPALSLPLPIDGASLPVGLQLLGRHGQDAALIALANQLELSWQ